jgi:hypothetical protein
MDTIVIDDIFDDDTNKVIIEYLQKQSGWHLDGDLYNFNIKYDTGDYSDTGMLLLSYETNRDNYLNQHNSTINVLGTLILDKILLKLKPMKFINYKLNRFLWNYYNKASTGIMHRDMESLTPTRYCSIVYYLNTCDGYTIIDDKEYESKSGRCVIFDSKLLHRGVGPSNDKKRFVLNIMFSYDDIIEE